jgi:hypothetical protein
MLGISCRRGTVGRTRTLRRLVWIRGGHMAGHSAARASSESVDILQACKIENGLLSGTSDLRVGAFARLQFARRENPHPDHKG